MSIATRIEAIEQHLTDDYSVLELAGADLTNVDKNIENLKQSWEERLLYFLANGTDALWNNWLPKVTGTGENITLNNTIEAKMDFVYKGNTSQESTTGKNLFNPSYAVSHCSVSGNEITLTGETDFYINGGYSYSMSTIFELTPGSYRCITTVSNVYVNIYGIYEGETTIRGVASNTTTPFNATSTLYVKGIRVRSVNGNSLNGTKVKIYLGTGSEYEEYTGNQPSPSPDYPQDIQVVSGDNTIKVEGKNLCNGINQYIFLNIVVNQCGANSGDTGLYIKTNGGKYTISTTGTQSRYRVACTKNKPSSTTQTAYNGVNKDSTNDSITIDTTGHNYLVVNATDLTKIQIEKSSQATTYQPYQSASYPINLGNIELCKIGDYQDKIYKDNGKWYLNKQIGKVVLNGSEANWGSGLAYDKTVFYYNIADILVSTSSDNDALLICNNYKGYKISAFLTYNDYFLGRRTNQTQILFRNKDISTLSDFKTWLGTHNTNIYYPLATPTTTEITDTTLISQLEAIKKSYNTQTNISQTNADKPFILDVVALGELI